MTELQALLTEHIRQLETSAQIFRDLVQLIGNESAEKVRPTLLALIDYDLLLATELREAIEKHRTPPGDAGPGAS